MRCCVLPFVLRCCVLRCAFYEHTAVVPGMIQVPGTIMYVLCTRLFAFFSCDCPLSIPMFPHPRKYHTYCRSERDINKHTVQRRATSSAQAPRLLISIRTKESRASSSCPLIYMFQLNFPCVSVDGGAISVLFAIFLRKFHLYYCRSERDIANIPHSTDRTISSAQVALGIVKSLVALNHGPVFSDHFTLT